MHTSIHTYSECILIVIYCVKGLRKSFYNSLAGIKTFPSIVWWQVWNLECSNFITTILWSRCYLIHVMPSPLREQVCTFPDTREIVFSLTYWDCPDTLKLPSSVDCIQTRIQTNDLDVFGASAWYQGLKRKAGYGHTAPSSCKDMASLLSGDTELTGDTELCHTGSTVQNTWAVQKVWSQIEKARIPFERPADSMAPAGHQAPDQHQLG